MAIILDISHHQHPEKMNYTTLAKQVDLVIIRTQYGSNLIDRHYQTHHQAFQKQGIPTAAYAWVRGVSVTDMEKEATDFYQRTKEFNPTFWFLDVEEKSMKAMRKGISAYVQQLRSLGAEKIGIYVGHHLYRSFDLNVTEADAVWIPHYGKNNGTINSKPKFACDIHQYTSKGKLDGYTSHLDLNHIISNKTLSYFTSDTTDSPSIEKDKPIIRIGTDQKGKRVENIYHTPVRFYDSSRWTNPTGTFSPGEGWLIEDQYKVNGSPMYQVKNSKGKTFYITANPKYVAIKDKTTSKKKYHTVQYGDTVSELAIRYQTTTTKIKKWNNLKDVNKINVGQELRVE